MEALLELRTEKEFACRSCFGAPTSRCKLKWKANIEGKSPRKSFDITKAAGGVAKAHVKTFNVTVTENYLEIHLFWAGKATCCIPKQGYYGPLIAAVHVVVDFTPPRGGRNKTRLVVGVTVLVVVVGLLLLLSIFYLRRKANNEDEKELLGIGSQPNTFSYAELKATTEDFNRSNK